MSKDTFWDDFEIPYQEEDDDYDFANAVTVADQFIKAIQQLGRLSREAEYLVEDIAKAELEEKTKTGELRRLHRELVANSLSGIKSGTTVDRYEAFIYAKALESGKVDELETLEAEVEEVAGFIEKKTGELNKLRSRLKALETKMSWAEQFLNYEKYHNRAELKYGGR